MNGFAKWKCPTCKDWGTLEADDSPCPAQCEAAARVAAARSAVRDAAAVVDQAGAEMLRGGA